LKLQLAAEADPVDDPAAVWPEDRETVIAGTLKVTGVMALDNTPTPLVFDPMRLTDGVESSNDPVLRFRPRVYSLSGERRRGSA
jgi:catalase